MFAACRPATVFSFYGSRFLFLFRLFAEEENTADDTAE